MPLFSSFFKLFHEITFQRCYTETINRKQTSKFHIHISLHPAISQAISCQEWHFHTHIHALKHTHVIPIQQLNLPHLLMITTTFHSWLFFFSHWIKFWPKYCNNCPDSWQDCQLYMISIWTACIGMLHSNKGKSSYPLFNKLNLKKDFGLNRFVRIMAGKNKNPSPNNFNPNKICLTMKSHFQIFQIVI